QNPRRAEQIPKQGTSPGKQKYGHCKAKTDALRRGQEAAEDRKEAHLRVVEKQRVVSQAARERVAQITGAMAQILDDLAREEQEVRDRARKRPPRQRESGVREEKQATRDAQRD
ncbi:unnamed protein product, partial [Laminaria digitata]